MYYSPVYVCKFDHLNLYIHVTVQVQMLYIVSTVCTYSHSLMNMGTMHLHLLDNSGEFVEEFLVSIQGEQVFLSEQEAKAVTLCPAQAMT